MTPFRQRLIDELTRRNGPPAPLRPTSRRSPVSPAISAFRPTDSRPTRFASSSSSSSRGHVLESVQPSRRRTPVLLPARP